MTTKQISEAVGKPERTVQRWAKATGAKMASIDDKLASVAKTGKPADYDLDETVAIIEHGMGKNAASLFRENARHQAPASPTSPEAIAIVVRETVTAMVPALIAAIRGALPEKTALALPPANNLTERAQLRQIVNRAAHSSGDHAGTWRELYSQFYYRYSVNLRERAKNRGMDVLDYAETEGLITDLLALAVSIYGAAA